MSEYRPIETLEEYDALNSEHTIPGYQSGRRGDPEPRNCTRSYWHGWRMGRMDAGLMEQPPEHIELVKLLCERERAKTPVP